MEESLAELAAYFCRKSEVPDQELVRLTAAARAGGNRWTAIAAACGVQNHRDVTGIVCPALWNGSDSGAELLFGATQNSLHRLSGSRSPFPPLHWDCQGCGRRVTDRAPVGRPVHVEHGHTPDCARLAADQAAEDKERRERLPQLIVHSEEPIGPVQRHWLRERIEDDCPRCGWHGYFHHYIATIDGDWSAAVCDDCRADLHPDITVQVRFFSACLPADGRAVAAIRQRTRSDDEFPDVGQAITWRLWWQHTPMLVEDQRGSCVEEITEISRDDAEQIAGELVARYWPPEAGELPWVASAYPT